MGMQAQPQAPDSGSVAQGQALEQAASTASTVESCSSDEGGGAIQTQVDKAEAAVALVAKKKRRGGKSGRGDGRRRKHERIKQLTCLLEEVCALENEITRKLRRSRQGCHCIHQARNIEQQGIINDNVLHVFFVSDCDRYPQK